MRHFGFETFPLVLMVSVSVSEMFGIEKSTGIGFEKIWYRKKYQYRFQICLVSKKVAVSVSKNFGIEKNIGIGFAKKFGIKKNVNLFQNNLVKKILKFKKSWIFF